jgi:hypothetical protein
MQPTRQNKRKGRQLLVAAVGIASVSYVGTIQGCADVDSSEEPNEGALIADEEAGELGESQQALSVGTAVLNNQAAIRATDLSAILKRGGLPGSGNLMPGPGGVDIGGIGGGGVIIKVPIPVGNLMATPIGDEVAIDPAALEALEALEQR